MRVLAIVLTTLLGLAVSSTATGQPLRPGDSYLQPDECELVQEELRHIEKTYRTKRLREQHVADEASQLQSSLSELLAETTWARSDAALALSVAHKFLSRARSLAAAYDPVLGRIDLVAKLVEAAAVAAVNRDYKTDIAQLGKTLFLEALKQAFEKLGANKAINESVWNSIGLIDDAFQMRTLGKPEELRQDVARLARLVDSRLKQLRDTQTPDVIRQTDSIYQGLGAELQGVLRTRCGYLERDRSIAAWASLAKHKAHGSGKQRTIRASFALLSRADDDARPQQLRRLAEKTKAPDELALIETLATKALAIEAAREGVAKRTSKVAVWADLARAAVIESIRSNRDHLGTFEDDTWQEAAKLDPKDQNLQPLRTMLAELAQVKSSPADGVDRVLSEFGRLTPGLTKQITGIGLSGPIALAARHEEQIRELYTSLRENRSGAEFKAARAAVGLGADLLRSFGGRTGRKIAAVGRHATDIFSTINAIGGFGKLKALSLGGGVQVVSSLVGSVFGIADVLGGGGSSSQVLSELGTIRDSISTLKAEMHERFDRVDAKLDVILDKLEKGLTEILQGQDRIESKIDALKVKLDEIRKDFELQINRATRAIIEYSQVELRDMCRRRSRDAAPLACVRAADVQSAAALDPDLVSKALTAPAEPKQPCPACPKDREAIRSLRSDERGFEPRLAALLVGRFGTHQELRRFTFASVVDPLLRRAVYAAHAPTDWLDAVRLAVAGATRALGAAAPDQETSKELGVLLQRLISRGEGYARLATLLAGDSTGRGVISELIQRMQKLRYTAITQLQTVFRLVCPAALPDNAPGLRSVELSPCPNHGAESAWPEWKLVPEEGLLMTAKQNRPTGFNAYFCGKKVELERGIGKVLYALRVPVYTRDGPLAPPSFTEFDFGFEWSVGDPPAGTGSNWPVWLARNSASATSVRWIRGVTGESWLLESVDERRIRVTAAREALLRNFREYQWRVLSRIGDWKLSAHCSGRATPADDVQTSQELEAVVTGVGKSDANQLAAFREVGNQISNGLEEFEDLYLLLRASLVAVGMTGDEAVGLSGTTAACELIRAIERRPGDPDTEFFSRSVGDWSADEETSLLLQRVRREAGLEVRESLKTLTELARGAGGS